MAAEFRVVIKKINWFCTKADICGKLKCNQVLAVESKNVSFLE